MLNVQNKENRRTKRRGFFVVVMVVVFCWLFFFVVVCVCFFFFVRCIVGPDTARVKGEIMHVQPGESPAVY